MLPLAPFVTTAADFHLAAAGDGGMIAILHPWCSFDEPRLPFNNGIWESVAERSMLRMQIRHQFSHIGESFALASFKLGDHVAAKWHRAPDILYGHHLRPCRINIPPVKIRPR